MRDRATDEKKDDRDESLDVRVDEIKALLSEISSENSMVLDRTRVKDIRKTIHHLEDQRDRFKFLSQRLANVSADSAELYVELEERNQELSKVTARSAELVAEIELKKEALESANRELARANANASELMAEIEIKNERIEELNRALANANAQAAEILAELEESKEELRKTKTLSREKSSRLKKYLDVASIFFVVIGKDQRIKLINPEGCRILGMREDELIGKNWFDMAIPEKTKDGVKRIFDRIMDGELEGTEYVESDIVNSEGELRRIAWHNNYIRNEDENIISTVSSGEDITEKIKMRRELEERENQYRMLAENQADVVLTIGIDGTLTYISPAIRSFGGYEPSEEIGKNMTEYLADPGDIERVIPLIEDVVKGRKNSLVEVNYQPREGKPFPVEVSGSPFYENGELKGLQCVMRDISSRKRVEKGLQFHKNIGELLMNAGNISDGLKGFFDLLRDYTNSTTSAFIRITGNSAYVMEGEGITEEFRKGSDRENVKSILSDVSDQSEPVRGKIKDIELMRTLDPDPDAEYVLFPVELDRESRGLLLMITGKENRPSDHRVKNISGAVFTVGEFIKRMNARMEEKKSKENLDLALEGGDLGLWYLEVPTGRFVQDGRLIRKLGYPSVGSDTDISIWNNRLKQSDREMVEAKIEEIIQGRDDQADLEVRIYNANGGISWVNVKGKVTKRDEEGRPLVISGTHQNITPRKNMENALSESEERYRNIFERSNLGIYRSSPEGKILLANRALARMLGYDSVEELTQRDIEKEGYMEPEERRSFKRRIEKEGKITGTELVWRKKNGEELIVNESARCVRDDEGNVLFYEGTVEDITERKKTEDALINSQRQIETILNSVQSGIMIIDAEHHTIVDANPKALDIIGVKRDDMIGKICHEFVCPAEKGNCPVTDLGCDVDNSERELINCRGENITILKTVSEVDIQGRRILVESFVDVTEQKRVREELKDEKDRFESITSSAQDAIVMIDHKGDITLWNEAAERIFGYDEGEVKGKNLHKMVAHEDFYEAHFRAFEHFKHTGEGDAIGKTMELKGVKKDGTVIPVELSLSRVMKEGKWNAIGIMRDISERKRVERRIKESEEKLSTFMSSATDAFMLFNRNMELIMANDLGMKRFSVNSDDAIGKHITELVPVDRKSESYQRYLNVIETGEPCFIDEMMPNWKPGMEQFSLKAFRSGKGLGLIISDITPIKEAKYETEIQRAYMEELFESSPEAICVLDNQDHVSKINKGFTELFGYTPDEAAGQKIVDLVVPPEEEEGSLVLTKNVAMGETIYRETVRKKKDGTPIDVSILGTPISIRDQLEAVYAIYRDISEQKKAQREMKQAKEKAEEAARMKSEFLANMSHEIRTPMNAILGFTDILSGEDLTGKQRAYIESIGSSGKTLLRLINDILDLSKLDSGKLKIEYKNSDPHSVFKEMEHVFQKKVDDKGIDLNVSVSDEVPRSLIIDEVRLRQILLNLVGNAVKFTEKGRVDLSVERTNMKDDGSMIDLRFSVKDTGIGIPADQIERIFGSFEQMKGQDSGKYGGTGLGLAITKRLVEMMNGRIWVESEVGTGSEFIVELEQVSVGSALEPEAEEEGTDSIEFLNQTVLIVDDIEANRQLVKGMLDSRNLEFCDAGNGKAALDLMENGGIDLVLMDMKMPVMDGYQATRSIKTHDQMRNIPVVALTASAMEEDRRRIMDIGCDGYLRKPVRLEDLVRELARFLSCRDMEEKPIRQELEISDDPERIKAYHGVLSGEVKDMVSNALDTGSMDDAMEIAERFLDLADQSGLKSVEEYGRTLKEAVDGFDIEGMTYHMNQFDSWLSRMEDRIEQNGM